jgi:hypothetical protein
MKIDRTLLIVMLSEAALALAVWFFFGSQLAQLAPSLVFFGVAAMVIAALVSLS